ncbi:hypothetical protein PM082_020269 [Marasmius tenuissimus]|nr:hypothetical protein PM082_020269 [Marasmius tenuissimus]
MLPVEQTDDAIGLLRSSDGRQEHNRCESKIFHDSGKIIIACRSCRENDAATAADHFVPNASRGRARNAYMKPVEEGVLVKLRKNAKIDEQ